MTLVMAFKIWVIGITLVTLGVAGVYLLDKVICFLGDLF